jgi:predicted O-methyltransferase YrrM
MTTWFAQFAENNFDTLLPATPIDVLQIGVFEGDASRWLLDNRSVTRLVDVDCWDGPPMSGVDYEAAERIYDAAIGGHPLVEKVKSTSDEFFKTNTDTFDFVYVDGDHDPKQTYRDGINGWKALRPGGLIGFDDYLWQHNGVSPKSGIDAAMKELPDAQVVHHGYQVWLRKP